jgi:hypothetical protein
MATWSILRGNNELPLTGRAPFDLVSVNGIGVATIRRLTGRSPFQDGDSDLGFRLDPRLVNLVLFANAASLAAADAYRSQLYDYLKPHASAVNLRCERDDGAIRQLDCYPVGMIDAPISDQDRIWAAQKLAVQLRAAEPIWYDPQIKYWAAVGGAATGTSGFTVPVDVPWVQTENTYIDVTVSLAYAGSWASYPTITFIGPLTSVSLENVTTGQVLDLPNLSLTAGETVTIDLRYGHKTVVNQLGDNLIGQLSDASDLADWHLAPAPEASGGINVLNLVVNADATDATGVQMSYYDRYIGL